MMPFPSDYAGGKHTENNGESRFWLFVLSAMIKSTFIDSKHPTHTYDNKNFSFYFLNKSVLEKKTTFTFYCQC